MNEREKKKFISFNCRTTNMSTYRHFTMFFVNSAAQNSKLIPHVTALPFTYFMCFVINRRDQCHYSFFIFFIYYSLLVNVAHVRFCLCSLPPPPHNTIMSLAYMHYIRMFIVIIRRSKNINLLSKRKR